MWNLRLEKTCSFNSFTFSEIWLLSSTLEFVIGLFGILYSITFEDQSESSCSTEFFLFFQGNLHHRLKHSIKKHLFLITCPVEHKPFILWILSWVWCYFSEGSSAIHHQYWWPWSRGIGCRSAHKGGKHALVHSQTKTSDWIVRLIHETSILHPCACQANTFDVWTWFITIR